MNQKRWYKKKRIWGLIFLISLFFLTKMEWGKIRYHQNEFITKINQGSQVLATYGTRTFANKTIHFIQKINQKNFPLLVMVHGSPGALNAYEVYLQDSLLNAKVNMISVDRAGFGYSDFGTAESSLTIQAGLIAEILKDFSNQKIILMGHSMGGPVIAKLAMDFPELVDAMLMVAPSISPDLEPSNTWRKVLNFPLIRWLTPDGLRVCNQEIIPLENELEAMRADWKNIKIPVTVVQGEADKLVPKGNAFFAKKMMPDSPVKISIVKDGNHFILWSETSLIKKELLELLQQLY